MRNLHFKVVFYFVRLSKIYDNNGSFGVKQELSVSDIEDNWMKQYSQSYIRDSSHLINILNNLTMQCRMLLCTLDITSLYTNIPHNEGIQSIKETLAIHRTPNNLPHNSYIIELLEVALTNNHFEFSGKHYNQVSGTAMGSKLAPYNANFFVTKFEEKYVYTYPLQPKLWKRFIDDIFFIWPHGMDSPLEFINHLNTVHSTINLQEIATPQKYHFWT